MAKIKKNKKTIHYIAIDDLSHNLGLLKSDVVRWLKKDNPKIAYDHRNRESIVTDYLDKYSDHPEYEQALIKSIESEIHLRTSKHSGKAEFYRKERLKLVEIYSDYISDLEALHKRNMDKANKHDHESCVVAAYMLFSKVISCLKMGCLNLKHGFWYCGSLLREIDETLDVAQYFIITKDTEAGRRALHGWFRQNIVPKHVTCREAISKYMASLIGDFDDKNHQDLMNELYQKKSKWTHPTYSTIREVTEYDIGQTINIKSIDYGPCLFELKVYELAHFYRSSIWSSFQAFLLCFKDELPLDSDDVDLILKYDKLFQGWDAGCGMVRCNRVRDGV